MLCLYNASMALTSTSIKDTRNMQSPATYQMNYRH